MRALWIEDQKLIGDALKDHLHHVMPELSLDLAPDLVTANRLLAAFRYQLVLLDWWLRGEDGASALRCLAQAGCTAPVIVVSGDEREALKHRALALGAAAYVAKADDPEKLLAAIHDAIEGRIAARPVRQGGPSPQPPAPEPVHQVDIQTAFPEVTARQAEVFRGLVRGLSDKQIARELGISDTTVKTHVGAILQIVGVNKRGMAAHEALRRGAGVL